MLDIFIKTGPQKAGAKVVKKKSALQILAGHGEESVSTALSSHSLPNQMTEAVSTLTSRPSRRAATTGVSSASRMDQHKRLVRVFLQTNDYLHPGSSFC
jgi:hypothetical protein